MALRHLVFADCAAAVADPWLQDVFLGLAYGLLPMCVAHDDAQTTLLFRRSLGPERDARDKATRLALAAQELQADPDVAWYNAQLAAAGAPLHVAAASLSVAWAIGTHDVATHLRVVPALLAWTRWDRDAPWRALRGELAADAGRPLPSVPPRHLRLAQILECAARDADADGADVAAACQRAAVAFAAGRLVVTCDPVTHVVTAIEELDHH